MTDPSATDESLRLVVVGATGLIGTGLVAEGIRQGLEVVPVARDVQLESVIRAGDLVVNCALHPQHRGGVYDEAVDLERQSAKIAREAGARVLMLSTRKVYVPEAQWGARETDPLVGSGAGYGPNKARTEGFIRDLFADAALIVRLSNVFGFEYAPERPRPSFFGQMLFRLKTKDEILFDMSPATRRDFISIDEVSRALVCLVRSETAGVFNLAAGAPIVCGEVAGALITGYGRGRLCAADEVRDEFYLDNSKWTSKIGALASVADVLSVATRLGDRLKHA